MAEKLTPAERELRRYTGRHQWLKLFLEFLTYLRIDSKEVASEPDGRGARLRVWNTQRIMLEQLAEGFDTGQHVFRILKSRQLGCTTLFLAFDLFWLASHPRMIGALSVDTEDNLEKFRQIIAAMLASFPYEFFGERFRRLKHNSSLLSFSNGSRLEYLVAGVRSETWGEGQGYSLIHSSELSKYGTRAGIDSFFKSFSVGNPDRIRIEELTANGMNHWRDMWYEAEDDSSIRRVFIGWWAKELNCLERTDPDFRKHAAAEPSAEESAKIDEVWSRYRHQVTIEQLAWYRKEQTKNARETLQQNEPWLPEEAFVLSGYSFFRMPRIQERYDQLLAEETMFKAYKFIIGNAFWTIKLEQIFDANRLHEVELKVWEDPKDTAQYVIGCDPSWGHSEHSDNHCCSVWRCYADRLVQVAEYADNRYEAHQCAWVLAGLAGAYKNCMVAIELGGPGRAVTHEFENIQVQMRTEMYQPQRESRGWEEDFLTGARKFLYHRIDHPGPGYCYHFETNNRTKVLIFNLYRDGFSTYRVMINSVQLLEEMATMVQAREDIGPAAPGKQHDDRPFAAALANYAYRQWVEKMMVEAGATYDRITAEENRDMTRSGEIMINRLVYDYLAGAEARANEEPEPTPWMKQRGFG